MAIALDIGGTNTVAALVDEDGRVLHRTAVATVHESGRALVDSVLKLALGEMGASPRPALGIGVSVAGAVDSATGDIVWAPNIASLDTVPLGRLLRDATGLPISVGFDGHMAALGESWVGAGRGVQNMVLLIVGTGIGGGLILDGRLYRGRDDLAGAAGWMIVDAQSLDAAESRARGNLESIASGPAIARAAEKELAHGHASSLQSPVSAEAVLAAAGHGDDVARRVLTRAGRCLGHAVAGLVSLLNPDMIVLGGGVGSTGMFLEAVRAAVEAFAQPISRRRVRVEPAVMGTDAGLIGAARVVFGHEEQGASGYALLEGQVRQS